MPAITVAVGQSRPQTATQRRAAPLLAGQQGIDGVAGQRAAPWADQPKPAVARSNASRRAASRSPSIEACTAMTRKGWRQAESAGRCGGVAGALEQPDHQFGLHLALQIGAGPRPQQVQRRGPAAVGERCAPGPASGCRSRHPDRPEQLPPRPHGDHHAPAEPVVGGGLDEQRLVGAGEMPETTPAARRTPPAPGLGHPPPEDGLRAHRIHDLVGMLE